MPTYAITSDAADGGLSKASTVYATARSMVSPSAPDLDRIYSGQDKAGSTFNCYEGFLAFDTSVIPSTETIVSATLRMCATQDGTTTDFVAQVRSWAWMSTLAAADAVAGASLSGLTLLATYDTSLGITVGSTYHTFTDVAMVAAINRAGFTEMIVSSDRMAAGTVPTGSEYVTWIANSADSNPDTSPTLTVITADIDPLRTVTSPNRW